MEFPGANQIPPTHKKHGLDQNEFRKLFTPIETARSDELEAYINDVSYNPSWLDVDLEDYASDIGVSDLTYRQLMRMAYKNFASSSKNGIDIDDARTILAVNCLYRIGLIDSKPRLDEILLGLPL